MNDVLSLDDVLSLQTLDATGAELNGAADLDMFASTCSAAGCATCSSYSDSGCSA